jgi:hypothetical protein
VRPTPAFELADVVRRHGGIYAKQNAGHLGRVERRVLAAVAARRIAALGGHVERGDDCGLTRIAHNSCRNRACPKRQGAARGQWLADREAELPPVPYFHVFFALPAASFDKLTMRGGDRFPEQGARQRPADALNGPGAWPARRRAPLETSARWTKAFLRARVVENATDRLRMILAYCLGEQGLRSASAWASAIGLVDISNVALLYRLRHCGDWLALLVGQTLAFEAPKAAQGRLIRLIDATTVPKVGALAKTTNSL